MEFLFSTNASLLFAQGLSNPATDPIQQSFFIIFLGLDAYLGPVESQKIFSLGRKQGLSGGRVNKSGLFALNWQMARTVIGLILSIAVGKNN